MQLLDDVRVVSLAINLPGPLAAARLAEFGASVTKIEPPSGRVVLEEAAERAGDAVRHGIMGDGAMLGGAFPGYGISESADGYVALGAVEPHFFTLTLETFGVDGTHEALRKPFAA